MALRKRPLATGVAALLFSSWASAVGLGEIQLHSALNEPLDAEIRLHNLGDLGEDEILAGLASAAEFTHAGVGREAILSELSFRLDLSNPAVPLLRVNSKRPIREPYLNFLVDVRWPSGRLLREYTLLLDLPVHTADRAVRSRAVDAPQSLQVQEQRPPPTSPAPHRDVSAAGGQPLAGGEEYRVGAGETLWSIASRVSGSGSVHSKLAAIHQLNPAAFIDGDINLLREGEILRLPEGSRMAAVPAQPAPAPARQLREDGDVAAARFAATAPGSGGEFDRAPAGRLRLSAIDPNTANENELMAPGGGEERGVGAGLIGDRLQDIQDELARTQRENHELRSRLGSLEEQLATMQRMLEVGSDEMRAVQLAAGSEGKLDEERDVDHTVAQEAERSAGQVKGPASDALREEPVVTSPSPAPAAAAPARSQAAQVEATQPQTNKGWFETVSSYLIYILGALAALIVALVVVVLRKRRQDGEDEDYSIPSPAVERQRLEPAPPASPVGAGESPPWSPVSSLDDIALDEEDDLFAEPAGRKVDTGVEPVPGPEPSLADRQPAMDEIEDIELDLSEFELDDFAPDLPASEDAAPATLDEALGLDDFDFLGEADEGETQLGLAQAYLDMGDQGSAREILQEVIESGSEAHRERARALLDGLR